MEESIQNYTTEATKFRSLEKPSYIEPLDEWPTFVLAIIFSLVLLLGSVGNGLVSYGILTNGKARIPSNLIVMNVVIAGLLLSLFSLPIKFIYAYKMSWPLGLTMCKLHSTLELACIYVSSITITLMALNLHTIFKKFIWVIPTMAVIWFIGLLLSYPSWIYRTVEDLLSKSDSGSYVMTTVCYQNFGHATYPHHYFIFQLVIKSLLPIVVMALLYICRCYMSCVGHMIGSINNNRLVSLALVSLVMFTPVHIWELCMFYIGGFNLPLITLVLLLNTCQLIGVLGVCIFPIAYCCIKHIPLFSR